MPHSVPTKGSACNQNPIKKHLGVGFGSALLQETCISSGHKRVYPLNLYFFLRKKKTFWDSRQTSQPKIENQERRRAVINIQDFRLRLCRFAYKTFHVW
jgi:hypothetical protein